MFKNNIVMGLCLILSVFFTSVCTAKPPVDNKACEQINSILQTKLHIKANSTLISTNDFCLLSIKGTGKQFESKQYPTIEKMRNALDDQLKKEGWEYTEEAKSYDADAPFSTQFARVKNHSLLIVNMEAESLIKGKCPEDKPIDLYGNCKLQPDQRSYVISIKVQSSKN